MTSRVAYYYDDDFGSFYFGQGHPMRPFRARLTHHLIIHYGLYKKMKIYHPIPLSALEMTKFHSDDYIHFLQHVTPDNMMDYPRELQRYNIDVDCPVFDGLFNFCQLSCGASVGGAVKINSGSSDIVINWTGGMHHAKKTEASGFCYVNDIVLAILELLSYHSRVLYIDIDIHHGDAVEEAFYTTDRVMTVSFHKLGDYFPGTGHPLDIGVGNGKGYAINVPLHEGIDDNTYLSIFKPVVARVMETYRPYAVVMQCGADSLTRDRLGCFNLTIEGHSGAIEFVKSFGLPMLVLGGGGYTMRNVARCWAYETGILLGENNMSNEIPFNEFYDYYGPSFELHLKPNNMENRNSSEYVQQRIKTVYDHLSKLPPAPSVEFKQRDTSLYPNEEEFKKAMKYNSDTSTSTTISQL